MSQQTLLPKPEEKKKKKQVVADVQAKAATVTEVPVTSKPQRRILRFMYNSCCGCGCSDVEMFTLVDGDSPLQDGDFLDSLPGKFWGDHNEARTELELESLRGKTFQS